jgi:phage I-like protein
MEKTLRFPPIQIQLSDQEIREIVENPNNTNISRRVQILKVGTFRLADGRTLNVTPEILARFVDNFKNKVRGIDLAVDYKHDADNIAAGWIRDVHIENEGNELWAEVDWTKNGMRVLAEKEFRYLSADFNLNYQSNETLEQFGPTLFGAGLTNRPVMKDMEPAIALTEVDPNTNQNRGSEMNLEELQKKYDKLEKKQIKLAEDNEKLEADNAKLAGDAEKLQELEMTPEQMLAKIKELEAELAQMKGDAQMAEKEQKFNTLLSEGKVVPAQKEAYIGDDMVKFAELSGEINKDGKGNSKSPKGDSTPDPEDELIRLAEEKRKSDPKLDLGDAMSLVLSENPKLKKAYEENTPAYVAESN